MPQPATAEERERLLEQQLEALVQLVRPPNQRLAIHNSGAAAGKVPEDFDELLKALREKCGPQWGEGFVNVGQAFTAWRAQLAVEDDSVPIAPLLELLTQSVMDNRVHELAGGPLMQQTHALVTWPAPPCHAWMQLS